jgi:hypothetical protein
MNIKMKLAAVAAFAALSTSAFAVTDYDVLGNAVAADVLALGQAELAAIGTLAGDGNVAFINQETSSNMAYIDQTGATNFGSITQESTDGNLGVIYQIGDLNRAVIAQH